LLNLWLQFYLNKSALRELRENAFKEAFFYYDLISSKIHTSQKFKRAVLHIKHKKPTSRAGY